MYCGCISGNPEVIPQCLQSPVIGKFGEPPFPQIPFCEKFDDRYGHRAKGYFRIDDHPG
jgi:hypothetical protein